MNTEPDPMFTVAKPLYGHTSPETAYVVDDYPYGYTLRTKIRYWLEYKAKKGFRLVSQTVNPKTGAWNKPKASTYSEWAGAMYLDGNGHVQWNGLGVYSDEAKFLEFVTNFPGADLTAVKAIVPAKVKYLRAMVDGTACWKVNGVPQKTSEADIERYKTEIAAWERVAALVNVEKP